jgi:hypothetical protein
MAQWKKVLLSGSHFAVDSLKISDIGGAAQGDTILLMATGSVDSGSFKTTSSFQLVNGTDLTGSFGTNSGGETSYEGDGSGLTGVDSAQSENGIKPGAGVGLMNDGGVNQTFTGTNSGTFTIALKGATNFPGTSYSNEVNTQTAVNTKNLGVDGGILFATQSSQTKLVLDPDLPGNGLEWDPSYLNGGIGSRLRIDLDGVDGGSSGLLRTTNGLSISTNLDGDGLNYNSTYGIMSMSLASNSGLEDNSTLTGQSSKLSLASTVAGTGLTFEAVNDRSVININTGVVVTNETIDFEPKAYADGGIWQNTISQGQGINNLLYGVIAASTNNSISNSEYALGTGTQTFLSNPTVYFELSKVWGNATNPNRADFSITGDVTIQGDLTILSSSNISHLQVSTFATDDQFVVLNSGSQGTGPFSYYNGGMIVNTHTTNGQMSGSAIFYQSGSDSVIWGVTTEGQVAWDDINPGITDGAIANNTTIAAISTVTYATGDDPNTLQGTNPEYLGYDWDKQERRGTWYVDENGGGLGGESNVWLYVAEQGDGGGGGGK